MSEEPMNDSLSDRIDQLENRVSNLEPIIDSKVNKNDILQRLENLEIYTGVNKGKRN